MSTANIKVGEIYQQLETIAEKYKDMSFVGTTREEIRESIYKELQIPFHSEVKAYLDEHFNKNGIEAYERDGGIYFTPSSDLWEELSTINKHEAWVRIKPIFMIDIYPKIEGKKGNYTAHQKNVKIRFIEKDIKKWNDMPWNDFFEKQEKAFCDEFFSWLLKHYEWKVEYDNEVLKEKKKQLAKSEAVLERLKKMATEVKW